MDNKELLYKKINALRLEVDGSIVDNLKETVDALFQDRHTGLQSVEDDFCKIDQTECCGVGPIVSENYCPNCGIKIKRENAFEKTVTKPSVNEWPVSGAEIIKKAIDRSKEINTTKYCSMSYRFGYITAYDDAKEDYLKSIKNKQP